MSGNASLLNRYAIGGRYLLMESAETTFEQVSRAVYQVRLSGLYPVLAHPERTSYAMKNLELIEELVAREEVYCQITVASMEGLFGPRVKKTCAQMARRGLVHLLASDAHSAGHRAPRLSGGHRELARLAGDEMASAAVFENPRSMIGGEKFETPYNSDTSSRQGFMSRLLRRH
jgi:protein-tyrosine phosphatase